jgi:hypothetical protein
MQLPVTLEELDECAVARWREAVYPCRSVTDDEVDFATLYADHSGYPFAARSQNEDVVWLEQACPDLTGRKIGTAVGELRDQLDHDLNRTDDRIFCDPLAGFQRS